MRPYAQSPTALERANPHTPERSLFAAIHHRSDRTDLIMATTTVLTETSQGRTLHESAEMQKSILLATQLAREFAEEDALLLRQNAEISNMFGRTFACGICAVERPEDYIAQMDDCEHVFCRGCIKTYIIEKIEGGRYPIPCPVCTIDWEREPGRKFLDYSADAARF